MMMMMMMTNLKEYSALGRPVSQELVNMACYVCLLPCYVVLPVSLSEYLMSNNMRTNQQSCCLRPFS